MLCVIPRRHTASSVSVWPGKWSSLRAWEELGSGDDSQLTAGWVGDSCSGSWRKSWRKACLIFFFFPLSLPYSSRIHRLKFHPGFNLLYLSPWDWAVDLSFFCWHESCWWMCRLTLAIPAYSWGSGDAWEGLAYVLSYVIHVYKQRHVLICVY